MKIIGNRIPLDLTNKVASIQNYKEAQGGGAPGGGGPAPGGGAKNSASQRREDALNQIVQTINQKFMVAAQNNLVGGKILTELAKNVDSKFGTNIATVFNQSIKPLLVQEMVKQLNANIAKIANVKGKNSQQTMQYILELAKTIDAAGLRTDLAQTVANILKIKAPAGGGGGGGTPPGGGGTPPGGGGGGGGMQFGGLDVTGY